jgi:hypothetical protein
LDAGEYDAVRRSIEYPRSATPGHGKSEVFTGKGGDAGAVGLELILALGELLF